MKLSLKNLGVSLIAAFTMSACIDENAPPRYIDVPPPDWVKDVKVDVRKKSAYVTNQDGQRFKVYRRGTDIGHGLTASRDKNDLYIRDTNGVECNWNRSERLDYSHKDNPAYIRYQDSIAKLKP